MDDGDAMFFSQHKKFRKYFYISFFNCRRDNDLRLSIHWYTEASSQAQSICHGVIIANTMVKGLTVGVRRIKTLQDREERRALIHYASVVLGSKVK